MTPATTAKDRTTSDANKVSALRFAIQKNILIKILAEKATGLIALAFVIADKISSRENPQGEQR